MRHSSAFRAFGFGKSPLVTRHASSALRAEPAVYTTSDVRSRNGHGFDLRGHAFEKSRGEYLERRMLNMLPTGGRVALLSKLHGPEDSGQRYAFAFAQTKTSKMLDDSVSGHEFLMAYGTDLFTGVACEIPSVLCVFNLPFGCEDGQFVPIRDSSGSALHDSASKAVEGAILEFAERQCLAVAWISNKALGQFLAYKNDFTGQENEWLVTRLLERGNLTIYDISFINGVYVALCVFRPFASEPIFRFSCGAAAALTWQDALNKAIIEAWQTGLLIYQVGYFGVDNNEMEVRLINAQHKGDFRLSTITSHPKDLTVLYSISELVAGIQEVSSIVSVFTRELKVSNATYTFARVVSPDFFIHLDTSSHNNIQNRFARKIHPEGEFSREILPFA